MKMVKVEWSDIASAEDVWTFRRDGAIEPVLASSVGYLWKDFDSYIVLVQSIHENQVGRQLAIPKGVISSMYDLSHE